MQVHVANRQKALRIRPAIVREIVRSVIHFEQVQADEVSVTFVTTKAISELHDQFFGDPSTTDCISFPLDEPSSAGEYVLLGDIFVCPATALDYAKRQGRDPYVETTLYIVHGLLHLLGYDDIEPADRRVMRRAEARHMKRLSAHEQILR